MAALLAASGCSTVLHGTHEKIEIVSTPERALCRLYRENSGYLKSVVTPGAVYIPRSDAPLKIVCSKNGFQTATVSALATTAHGDIAGNSGLIPQGAAGLGVGVFSLVTDVANSANYELPDTISVNLKPQK